MESIKIRDIVLGKEKTQICLPLMLKTLSDLEEEIKWAMDEGVKVFEFRADLIAMEDNLKTLAFIREKIKKGILIYTHRSLEEGGFGNLSDQDYLKINTEVIKSGLADIIDVEFEKANHIIEGLIERAKTNQTHIQLSRHYIEEAINKEEMLKIFLSMQESEASMTKLVITAISERDALDIMDVSLAMRDKYGTKPFTAIAMGEKGLISRLAGGFLGSALVFAKGSKPSAPGQIDLKAIKAII